jgi:hypothetical protein
MMTNSEIGKQINTFKDSQEHLEKTIDLLYEIQLSKGPLIEAITLIRFEKPRLFTCLKTRLGDKSGFKISFEVSFEHEAARKSLGFS